MNTMQETSEAPTLSVDVVMPLDNRHRLTRGVLEDIANNTVIPEHVFLIDNSGSPETEQVCVEMAKRLPIVYLKQDRNIGVNASWNLGISLVTADIVSILNNDLALCSFFFEKTLSVFEQYPNVGLVVPETQWSSKRVREAKGPNRTRVHAMPHGQQGFAITARWELVTGQPIPSELTTFCGENWLYGLVRKAGQECVKCPDIPVCHLPGGISSRARTNAKDRTLMRSEIAMWRNVEKRLA
jgi:hypothetical protein